MNLGDKQNKCAASHQAALLLLFLYKMGLKKKHPPPHTWEIPPAPREKQKVKTQTPLSKQLNQTKKTLLTNGNQYKQ